MKRRSWLQAVLILLALLLVPAMVLLWHGWEFLCTALLGSLAGAAWLLALGWRPPRAAAGLVASALLGLLSLVEGLAPAVSAGRAAADEVLVRRLRAEHTWPLRPGGGWVLHGSAAYTLDARGLRATAVSPAARCSVLFFGGDGMFGLGLQDEATLPARFVRVTDATVEAVNLGLPGDGPQRALRLLETGTAGSLARARPAGIVYLWQPEDARRLLGWHTDNRFDARYVQQSGQLEYRGWMHSPLRLLEADAGVSAWQAVLRLSRGLDYALGYPGAVVRRAQPATRQLALLSLLRLRTLGRERLGVDTVFLLAADDDGEASGLGENLRRAGAQVLALPHAPDAEAIAHWLAAQFADCPGVPPQRS